jgi:hypothetical protein
VSLDRKFFRLLFLVPVLGLFAAGCSGIHTSQSVSPATFLVPGIFGQLPSPAQPSAPEASVQIPSHGN